MKLFAAIMALVVIVQSIMPCTDKAANFSKETKAVISSTENHNETTADACTPFCSCTCCAGFSINHSFASFNPISVTTNKILSAFLPANIIQVALPVWQPPQLV